MTDAMRVWLDALGDYAMAETLGYEMPEANQAAAAVIERALAERDAEIAWLRALLANPPKHKFWGAGEIDCPKDIKAGNGELHTLRCKVCGEDNPRDDICRAALKETPDGE